MNPLFFIYIKYFIVPMVRLRLYAATARSAFTLPPNPNKSFGPIGNLTLSDLLLVLYLHVCRRVYVFSTSDNGCLISWGHRALRWPPDPIANCQLTFDFEFD